MEIIILVTLLIMNRWQKQNGAGMMSTLLSSGNNITATVLGYFSSLLSGVTVGYLIWFVLELIVRVIKLYA